MCGIFGYIGGEKTDLSGFLLNGLSKLEYRGYDSSGISILQKSNFKIFKEIGEIKNLKNKINGRKFSGGLGIGHTRWATHGGVTQKNSHPHTDCKKELIVVHNGIIENYDKLKKSLQKKGHRFYSETDTEVFAHLIEDEINKGKKFLDAVRSSFNKSEGLNAVVALSEKGEMAAFKKGSPLVVGIGGKGAYFVSSDIPSLISETKKVVYIEDGEGVLFKDGTMQLISAASGVKQKINIANISMDNINVGRNGYPHFMLKEIYEQAEVVGRIAANGKSELIEMASMIKEAWGTYFSACGTAAYSGLAATYMFSEIAKRHVNFTVGSEFPYFEDFLVRDSLLIAASQSGETMDTLEAVKAAKRHGSKVLALVNVPGSTLSRLADKSFYLSAGPERAVVSTKAYIAKLSTFLLLAYTLAGKYGDGVKVLKETSKKMTEMLKGGMEKSVKQLAKKLSGTEHVYVIGRGVNYATALEGALKLTEASYTHAQGFAGGELKHGVIALIEKGTPCIVIVANDRAKESTLSNAMEVASRGGYIIGVSPTKENVFDYWIKVPDAGNASPIVSVVPLQLLGYYMAVMRGANPDKPRNLAKSVTVK